MIILFWIIISTFLIALVAFLGSFILFLKERILNKILPLLVAFSAGVLLSGAFLHLIPEAIEQFGGEQSALFKIFLILLLGFCFLFILENYISWHHHHTKDHPEISPFSYLIIFADSIHNFMDGLIIAGAFVVNLPLGLITAMVIAFHAIPQSIGDFGVLIFGGFKKIKALGLNLISIAPMILGGIAGFFISGQVGDKILYLLPFAAGDFIYIACSDLIPAIKSKESLRKTSFSFFIFLMGIGLMALLKFIAE